MTDSSEQTPRPSETTASPASPSSPERVPDNDGAKSAQWLRAHRGRRALFGLSVAGLGALALADNLQGSGHELLRTWWPLALVLWGAGRLLWPHPWAATASRVGALLLIGTGTAMTAVHLAHGALGLHQWWPVLLILAGAGVLLRGLLPRRRPDAWAQHPAAAWRQGRCCARGMRRPHARAC